MSEKHIPLSVLAKDLQIHRTHVKDFAVKNGVPVIFTRTRASGNQKTLAVTENDADKLRSLRQSWLETSSAEQVGSGGSGSGWFYIVQLLPELDENRVKLGFAGDPEQRLSAYRTICPEALLLRKWPCRSVWEATAIASASRIECKRTGQELFQCENVSRLIERCEQFFAMLPAL